MLGKGGFIGEAVSWRLVIAGAGFSLGLLTLFGVNKFNGNPMAYFRDDHGVFRRMSRTEKLMMDMKNAEQTIFAKPNAVEAQAEYRIRKAEFKLAMAQRDILGKVANRDVPVEVDELAILEQEEVEAIRRAFEHFEARKRRDQVEKDSKSTTVVTAPMRAVVEALNPRSAPPAHLAAEQEAEAATERHIARLSVAGKEFPGQDA